MSLKNKPAAENKQEFILPTERFQHEAPAHEGGNKLQTDNNNHAPLKDLLQVKKGDAAVLDTSKDNEDFNQLYDQTGKKTMQSLGAAELMFKINTNVNFANEVGKMLESSPCMLKMSPFLHHVLGAMYKKGEKSEKELEAKEAVIAAWEKRYDDMEQAEIDENKSTWQKFMQEASTPIKKYCFGFKPMYPYGFGFAMQDPVQAQLQQNVAGWSVLKPETQEQIEAQAREDLKVLNNRPGFQYVMSPEYQDQLRKETVANAADKVLKGNTTTAPAGNTPTQPNYVMAPVQNQQQQPSFAVPEYMSAPKPPSPTGGGGL